MKCLTTLVLASLILSASTSALSADKVASLLATLSTAKAQVEGRAGRVRACQTLRDPVLLQDLRGKYDSARNHFNGRIDAWLFSLQKRKEFKFDAEAEAKEIGGAISKVNDFILRSDKALASVPCATKVFWKEGVLAFIAITPALIGTVKSFWNATETTESDRSALIGALEQYRIAEWDGGTTLVAFDLKTQKFIPWAMVNDEVASQATTAIYVNKWIVKEKPGEAIVATKLPPGQLSNDYLLFTGKPSQIEKFVLQKKK
jgi:hypothetical protein